MRLLLFNPETEYALASGASFYTPPKQVEKLRKNLELLPEAWAEAGDLILVDDAKDLVSKFTLVEWGMLRDIFEGNRGIKIEPWGWNHALLRRFTDAGVPAECLPSKKTIDLIRKLAHRRITISLNLLWNDYVDAGNKVDLPVELKTEAECMEFYSAHKRCWMKAPWSSSGRGVINTAADMDEELVRQWCHGIIRRQGSVMGETGAFRLADFASEWKIKDQEAEYIGLSSFETSNRGKYISNFVKSQSQIKKEFNAISAVNLEYAIVLQKKIIENVFRGYEGFLGVDMLVETDGRLRPFVEVNLRRTMGMLYIQE
ncbi:MAG: hypothetical protein K2G85_02610 [Muribaculaceae bacterium]|nr:hypothetical protein [Muribaculaceae bacterium]